MTVECSITRMFIIFGLLARSFTYLAKIFLVIIEKIVRKVKLVDKVVYIMLNYVIDLNKRSSDWKNKNSSSQSFYMFYGGSRLASEDRSCDSIQNSTSFFLAFFHFFLFMSHLFHVTLRLFHKCASI